MAKRVPLDVCCEKQIATLPKDYEGLIDYIDISSINNTEKKIISYQTIEANDAPSRARQLLKKRDILVSTVRPNLNAVAVIDADFDNLLVGSTGYCVLRCNENIDVRYLFNFCQSHYFVDDMTSQATGASYPAVSAGIVRSSLIPSYSVEEQRRIATDLDKISTLIAKRREQLAKLDELVKSRFFELFGDLANPMCPHLQCRLVEACTQPDDIKCGPFGTQLSKDEYQNEGVAVWEIPHINSGFAIQPTHYLTPQKAKELSAYTLEPGDIAMSRKGNVGKCGLYPAGYEIGIIHSDVLRIRVDHQRVHPCFMMHQLHYSGAIQRQIEMVSSGAIMAGINVTKLKQIMVHIPDYCLQKQFATFVEQTDKLKLTIQQSLDTLETTKKALMQKYFG